MASGELERCDSREGNIQITFEMVARKTREFTELNRPLDFVIPAETWERQLDIVDHTSPVIEPAQTWGIDIMPFQGADFVTPGAMVPFGSAGGGDSFLAEIPGDVLADVGLLGAGNGYLDDSLMQVEIEPSKDNLGGFAPEDLSYSELAMLSLENYQIVDVSEPEPFDLYTSGLDFVIPDSLPGLGWQESPVLLDLTQITIPGGIGDLGQEGFSHLAEIDPVFIIDEPGSQPWFTTEITGDWSETIVADNPFLASIV